MINHDPGVTVTADRTNSVLRIDDVDPSYNGNYTCSPSKATPAYVNVHVLNATEGKDIHPPRTSLSDYNSVLRSRGRKTNQNKETS